MSLKKSKDIEIKDKKVSESKDIDYEQIGEIFSRTFNADEKTTNPAKDLETAKIILSIILDKLHIGSTTNLSIEHIEEISDAEMLNEIFDSPLIETKIDSFRIHRRSLTEKPKNLLEVLAHIVDSQNSIISDNDTSKWKNIFGRRFD